MNIRVKSFFQDLFRTSPKIYVFHHIPKCAGTSIKLELNRYFDLVPDYLKMEESTRHAPTSARKDLKNFKENQLLSGHFELPENHLHGRYPEILQKPWKYKTFTIMRDPLDLRISLYYYEIKKGRINPSTETLPENLLKRPNYISGVLPCTYKNYMQVLSRYHFIGIQEHMDETIKRLGDFLGKELFVPKLNQSRRDRQIEDLDDGIITKFKKINALDYAVYNHALKVFMNGIS